MWGGIEGYIFNYRADQDRRSGTCPLENQYASRLHRIHDMKKEVIIYDYTDLEVPMLAKMYTRRLRGYKAIGYEIT